MSNYEKWANFAKTIHSDTESEEEEQLSRYTGKVTKFIHIPPKEFSTKEQLCELLEEVPDFNEAMAQKRFGWKSAGSGYIPGYNFANAKETDMWRLHYDDLFLSSQTVPNPGARALLGTKSLGSMVVCCHVKHKDGERNISRKEVADLIMKRQEGKDREKIYMEQEAHAERMEEMKKLGMNPIQMK